MQRCIYGPPDGNAIQVILNAIKGCTREFRAKLLRCNFLPHYNNHPTISFLHESSFNFKLDCLLFLETPFPRPRWMAFIFVDCETQISFLLVECSTMEITRLNFRQTRVLQLSCLWGFPLTNTYLLSAIFILLRQRTLIHKEYVCI